MIIEIKETKQVIATILDNNNNIIFFNVEEPIVDVDLYKQEIKDWVL